MAWVEQPLALLGPDAVGVQFVHEPLAQAGHAKPHAKRVGRDVGAPGLDANGNVVGRLVVLRRNDGQSFSLMLWSPAS